MTLEQAIKYLTDRFEADALSRLAVSLKIATLEVGRYHDDNESLVELFLTGHRGYNDLNLTELAHEVVVAIALVAADETCITYQEMDKFFAQAWDLWS